MTAMRTIVGILAITWACLSSPNNFVNGFSVGTTPSSLSTTSRCFSTRRPALFLAATTTTTTSNNNNFPNNGRFSMLRQRVSHKIGVLSRFTNRKQILLTKFRRAVALLWTASLFYVGGARLSTLPSHASSSTTTTATPPITQVRMVSAATASSLDHMVDRYVQDHMFDTDQYDPVESAYREAYADATTGEYPTALQEINKDILGKGAETSVSTAVGDSSDEGSDGLSAIVFGKLRWAAGILQKQFGMKESMAYIIMGMSTIAILPIIAAYLLLSYSAAQKNVIQRSNKKRYGSDYSLDATIKEDDDVEAPDDDEDDDDDDDDDDE